MHQSHDAFSALTPEFFARWKAADKAARDRVWEVLYTAVTGVDEEFLERLQPGNPFTGYATRVAREYGFGDASEAEGMDAASEAFELLDRWVREGRVPWPEADGAEGLLKLYMSRIKKKLSDRRSEEWGRMAQVSPGLLRRVRDILKRWPESPGPAPTGGPATPQPVGPGAVFDTLLRVARGKPNATANDLMKALLRRLALPDTLYNRWLIQSLRDKCLDVYRNYVIQSIPLGPTDGEEEEGRAGPEEIADASPTPEEVFLDKQVFPAFRECLRQALPTLPEWDRRIAALWGEFMSEEMIDNREPDFKHYVDTVLDNLGWEPTKENERIIYRVRDKVVKRIRRCLQDRWDLPER